MREVELTDVPLIKRWLQNPYDCKMATGHATVNEDEITQWLCAQDQECWVLESAVGPVGYGEIWVDEDVKDLELAHFIISPDHRHQGFGKSLTELMFEMGKQYGFPVVFMRFYPENIPARNCYTSSGFTPVNDLGLDISAEWIWLSKAYVHQV